MLDILYNMHHSLGCYSANTKEKEILGTRIVDGKMTHNSLVAVSS
jgi:hypothetical protein